MIVYGNRKDGRKSPTVQEPYEPGARREPPMKRLPRWCLVDGKEYPTITAAARAMGWSQPRLSSALKRGMTELDGHSIALSSKVSFISMPNSSPMIIGGVKYWSIAQAARETGITKGKICSARRRNAKEVGGMPAVWL
ncbi:hypothetical protein [uncultured Slackia sp.]|uniref:hypothetical protein n=1 Tax=uncultured Slackia sp. TaxID=665903 RepID=UPI0025D1196F|nr:hypothetical protein [uncultured Slackia sp.]